MINDPWYNKRSEYVLDRVENYESGNFLYENKDNLRWDAYKVDKIPLEWNWDVSDEYWLSYNTPAKVTMLQVFASVFEERHNIKNPIAISLNDHYWIHPGTQRYYVNKVCNDFDLSALILDCSGGFNEKVIKSDFPNSYEYTEELSLSYSKNSNNTYFIKPVNVDIDTEYYKKEYENTKKIFELDFSLELWFNDRHFLKLPIKDHPKKSFKLNGMKGLAQLSIHLLSDPDYKFEELHYEPI